MDRINGSRRADCLFGGNGADAIRGMQGDDIITGGNGTDDLAGSDGNDTIYASERRDQSTWQPEWPTVAIEYARDLINGGSGDDTIWGAGGGMTARGDAGNDRLCATNADTLYGGSGSDEFFFGLRDAEIYRVNTTCQAFGGTENDRFYVDDTKSILVEVFGDAGNDQFYSRTAQRNHFIGGEGADSFVMEQSFDHEQRFYYYSVQESTRNAADVIGFGQGVTGRVCIMLDSDRFVSTQPRAIAGADFTTLIFLDRDNQQMFISVDNSPGATWRAEIFYD